MGIETIWILAACVAFSLFTYVYLSTGKQKAVWREFAHLHSLRYENPGFLRFPVVWGSIEGRSFKLSVDLGAKFGIHTGHALTFMALEIKGNFFGSIEIRKAGSFFDWQDSVSGLSFKTGDRAFDVVSEVYCDNEPTCSVYLTPERRRALLSLYSGNGEVRVRITKLGSQIILRSNHIIKDPAELEKMLNELIYATHKLDA